MGFQSFVGVWRLLGVSVFLLIGCGEAGNAPYETEQAGVPSFVSATCGAAANGPLLGSHLTEVDSEFLKRLEALRLNDLPEVFDLSGVFELDKSLIGYMLDQPDVQRLYRDDLINEGEMGRSILLALADFSTSSFVDYRELRRGLYHFYNCSRGFPESLEDFKRVYGDYSQWEPLFFHDSFPKIYPRVFRENRELGIYVAETIRFGEVHETEIILDGYRQDGALDFLIYLPNGLIASRGEFRAGADFVVGSSPYTCMSCHFNSDTYTYDVLVPAMGR